MSPNFKKYVRQIVKNSKKLANELKKKGWRIISGGTDNHLFLVDTCLPAGRSDKCMGISGKEACLTGRQASDRLEKAGIIVNKNTIPFETRKPMDPSGIRIGTAAVTTLGMKEKDMVKIADKIDRILKNC